jgi:hypothetical protein
LGVRYRSLKRPDDKPHQHLIRWQQDGQRGERDPPPSLSSQKEVEEQGRHEWVRKMG